MVVGATFIVTLREAFEAALLLGIVYTYLEKVGGRQHYRWVTMGALAGAIGSVLAGVGVTFASGALLDLGPDVVATSIMFVAVIVLTWHGYWMRQHARAIRGDVQRRIDDAQMTGRLWIVGLIAFTGVFREGAETVLFLWGLASQAGVAGWGGVAGGALGIASAAVLGWAIFRGGQRVSLSGFFAITSIVLLLVAAGLFSSGVGKLEGLGVLPSSPTVWDTSFALGDASTAGSFLAGLVGYRARPSVFELTAYAGYLALAGWLFFRPSGAVAPTSPRTTSGSTKRESALSAS